MECLVCLEEVGPGARAAAGTRCGTRGCGGGLRVCSECGLRLRRCVFCRARLPGGGGGDEGLGGDPAEASALMSRLYTALMYCALLDSALRPS